MGQILQTGELFGSFCEEVDAVVKIELESEAGLPSGRTFHNFEFPHLRLISKCCKKVPKPQFDQLKAT